MKIIPLIVSLFFVSTSFSQSVSDLGKMSFETVKMLQSTSPCETTGNKALRYCSEDGNFIIYTFENNKLNGIVFLTAFLTRTKAEQGLTDMVDDFTGIAGKSPEILGGMAVFKMTKDISVTYEIKEYQGTYFVAYSTLLIP